MQQQIPVVIYTPTEAAIINAFSEHGDVVFPVMAGILVFFMWIGIMHPLIESLCRKFASARLRTFGLNDVSLTITLTTAFMSSVAVVLFLL